MSMRKQVRLGRFVGHHGQNCEGQREKERLRLGAQSSKCRSSESVGESLRSIVLSTATAPAEFTL